VKIQWARIVVCTLAAFLLVLSAAALTLWLKLRGTPVSPVRNAAISPGVSGPQEIRLWPGKAPGSEDWSQQETETDLFGERYVRNVTDPTLTAYFPAAGTANGTAVIVCPGGGFHALYIDSEGAQVARYLNSIGVTAFILKYRLVQTGPAYFLDEFRRFKTTGGMDQLLDQMTPLIVADGREALRIVRSHASKWGLDPGRIGMIGFSAGGYLALSLAYRPGEDAPLDFIALLYPLAPNGPLAPEALHPQIQPIPMFVLCAADDRRVPPEKNCIRVYRQWRAAGLPAELHLMSKGGHGFGMTRQNLPTDAWPDLFRQWLESLPRQKPLRP
jgi:acetyl esterase/lipase